MREMIKGLFFFFQAEDGIRDPLVTGVQTCALPISQRGGLPRAVRAQESVQHAARHLERDVVHGDEAAVVLRDVLDPDHSTSSCRPPIRRTSSAWRARPPTTNRRCVASAGNWSAAGSTATQSARYTSGQA